MSGKQIDETKVLENAKKSIHGKTGIEIIEAAQKVKL
jgi:hypothetical protein